MYAGSILPAQLIRCQMFKDFMVVAQFASMKV